MQMREWRVSNTDIIGILDQIILALSTVLYIVYISFYSLEEYSLQ